MHQRTVPSDLRTKTVGAAQAEDEGRMTPACSCSWRHFSSSPSKPLGVRLTRSRTGAAPLVLISCLILVKLPKSVQLRAKARCLRTRPASRCLTDGEFTWWQVSWYNSWRCSGTEVGDLSSPVGPPSAPRLDDWWLSGSRVTFRMLGDSDVIGTWSCETGDNSPKTQPGGIITGASVRFTSRTGIGPLVSTRARATKMPPNSLGTGSKRAQGPRSQDPRGIPPQVTNSWWAGISVTSCKTTGTKVLPQGFRVTSQGNHRSFTHNPRLGLTCISSAFNTSQPNSRLSVIGATWTCHLNSIWLTLILTWATPIPWRLSCLSATTSCCAGQTRVAEVLNLWESWSRNHHWWRWLLLQNQ